MTYWLYEKLSDNQHDCVALEHDNKPDSLISLAKRLTQQWSKIGITRHYKVNYFEHTIWEN